MKFRKKPVIVEAEQYTEKYSPMGIINRRHGHDDKRPGPYVVTIHGDEAPVVYGDWIITEPDGIHHYPCKPDIFEATYEAVDE